MRQLYLVHASLRGIALGYKCSPTQAGKYGNGHRSHRQEHEAHLSLVQQLEHAGIGTASSHAVKGLGRVENQLKAEPSLMSPLEGGGSVGSHRMIVDPRGWRVLRVKW